MKQLEKLILVQYFVCEAEEIRLQGHTAFLGPNGTGKSALLDAIQIALMGADFRHIRFNVKSSVKDARSMRDYCLGFYRPPETTGNPAARPQRCRDTAHTYITLVFGDTKTGEKVSVGVAFTADIREDAHRVRGHFVARGVELTLDDHLQTVGDDKAPMPWRDFEVALRKRCAAHGVADHVILEGSQAYMKEMLDALRPGNVLISVEDFRKAFKKSLALRDMEKVSDLVRTFVIDEQTIDRQRATSHINRFRELEQIVRETELEIQELGECEREYKLQLDASRRLVAYQALQHTLVAESLQLQIADLEDEIEKLEKQDKGARDELPKFKRAVNEALQSLADHNAKMASTPSSKDLLAQTNLLDQARRMAGRNDDVYRNLLSRQVTLIQSVRTFADIPEKVRAELRALEVEYTRRDEGNAAPSFDSTRNLIERAAALLGQANTTLKRLALAKAKELEQATLTVGEIRKQIDHVKSGGGALDRTAAGAMNAFHKANLDASPVCDLVRVKDPEWQQAIEAYLGRNTFAFLFPGTEAERQALRMAKDRTTRLNGTKIIRVDKIPDEFYAEPSPQMVSSLFESSNRHALAFLRMQCAGMRMMHTDADMDAIANGLSRDGVLNKKASSLTLELPAASRLVLGRTASQDDVVALQAELNEWEARERTLVTAAGKLEKTSASCASLSDPGEILESQDQQRAASNQEIETLSATLEALRTGEAGEMARIQERLQGALNLANTEYQEAFGRNATCSAQLGARRDALAKVKTEAELERRQEAVVRESEDYDAMVVEEMRNKVEGRFSQVVEAEQLGEQIRFCKERADIERTKEASLGQSAKSKFREYLAKRRHDALHVADAWRRAYDWVSQRRQTLIETSLVENKELASEARKAAEETFRKDVVYKLRDGISLMKATIKGINQILQNCPPFSNGETYRFSVQPARMYADLHDYIINAGTREQGDMFNENTDVSSKIMQYLSPPEGSAPIELNPIEDFRLMFDFDLDIYVDGVKSSSLSSRMGVASNGEHLCPFHVIVAVALAHAYRLRDRGSSGGLCLMLLDEAFSAMDDQNALAAAEFITGMDLQLIMAGPSADSGKLSAFTQTVYELDRWDDTLEFHREELTDRAHALLKSDMPALNPDKVRERALALSDASA